MAAGQSHRPAGQGDQRQEWADLKARIDADSRRELAATLDRQAGEFDAAAHPKPAYVARVLGISLVAGTVADPQVVARDRLLDQFIDTAAVVFIQSRSAEAPSP